MEAVEGLLVICRLLGMEEDSCWCFLIKRGWFGIGGDRRYNPFHQSGLDGCDLFRVLLGLYLDISWI